MVLVFIDVLALQKNALTGRPTIHARHPPLVVHNKMPKCGSETMGALLVELSEKNK